MVSCMSRGIRSIVALLCLVATHSSAGEYRRIASINLAADQLLLQLADRDRIVALSFLAADPELSPLSEEAAGIPGIRGSAEEILTLRPDLLLAGPHGHRHAVEFARRMGVAVIRVPVANSFEEAREILLQMGEVLDAERRARELVIDMDERLRALRLKAQAWDPAPEALAFGHGGYAQGTGTMMHAILEAAGLHNRARDLEIVHEKRMSLEELLLSPPRFLIATRYHPDNPTRGDQFVNHRALRHIEDRMHRLEIPLATVNASGNLSVEAAEALHEQAARHMP